MGAVPTDAPIELTAIPEIRSSFFLEHREIGIVNVGGGGHGDGPAASTTGWNRKRSFISDAARGMWSSPRTMPEAPAKFYGFSAPAHVDYPNQLAGPDEGTIRELGEQDTSNSRDDCAR